jgi:hypothetical protein
LKPEGAANVKPKLVSEVGDKYVVYEDAWPGVDLVYRLQGEGLKEDLVIKRPGTATSFSFAISGAKLTNHPTQSGALAIEGLDPSVYWVSTTNISLAGQGGVPQQASQTTDGKHVTVSLDNAWMAGLDPTSYPIVIDPSFSTQYIGNNYVSYKSDGYVCNPSGGCGNSTGNTTTNYKWRSLILGTAGGALYGFLAGGFDTGGANAFEGAPDTSELNQYKVKIR